MSQQFSHTCLLLSSGGCWSLHGSPQQGSGGAASAPHAKGPCTACCSCAAPGLSCPCRQHSCWLGMSLRCRICCSGAAGTCGYSGTGGTTG
jgi:hypothetical protein